MAGYIENSTDLALFDSYAQGRALAGARLVNLSEFAQWSALLDANTCDWCSWADLRIFDTTVEPYDPPMHHGCRCIIAYITRDEFPPDSTTWGGGPPGDVWPPGRVQGRLPVEQISENKSIIKQARVGADHPGDLEWITKSKFGKDVEFIDWTESTDVGFFNVTYRTQAPPVPSAKPMPAGESAKGFRQLRSAEVLDDGGYRKQIGDQTFFIDGVTSQGKTHDLPAYLADMLDEDEVVAKLLKATDKDKPMRITLHLDEARTASTSETARQVGAQATGYYKRGPLLGGEQELHVFIGSRAQDEVRHTFIHELSHAIERRFGTYMSQATKGKVRGTGPDFVVDHMDEMVGAFFDQPAAVRAAFDYPRRALAEYGWSREKASREFWAELVTHWLEEPNVVSQLSPRLVTWMKENFDVFLG